ncbi:MAG TPA: transglutaminase-like domain-containing protein [Candidatus Acidoferrum sp.]|nr:transglutaminase-like domain-containing protein [Candidatus Acidoferrum sp.]
MTDLDQEVIDKYRRLSERLADQTLAAELRTLFERKYAVAELLGWVHEKVKWDAGEIQRHNDPLEILAYGRGRCGEFSILFAAVCLAHDIRARLILDMSDHVWIEVWEESKNNWMHIDPSEKRINDPFMYERDWKKNLSQIYAFENGKMEDVTKNYKMHKNSNGQLKLQRERKATVPTQE